MAVTVMLEDDAIFGVDFTGIRGAMTPQPVQVALGCVLADPAPTVLRFRSFYDPSKGAPPPASINRRSTAEESLDRMYCNDKLGCCVISGKAHCLGLWSGADAHPAGVVCATDSEIRSQYNQLKAGPGDSGCIITTVLEYCRRTGFLAGGKRYKIDGYVVCDARDKLEVQTVQYLFGSGTMGIDLPEEWTRSAVWDITSSRSVGGHDITPIDYDERGVYVSSWGKMYLMTWAAVTSAKYVREYYALLDPLWYGSDKLAPSGVDSAGLKKALQDLSHGELPEIPEDAVDPDPEEPDVPPTPPDPDETIDLYRMDVLEDGTITLRPVKF